MGISVLSQYSIWICVFSFEIVWRFDFFFHSLFFVYHFSNCERGHFCFIDEEGARNGNFVIVYGRPTPESSKL